MQLQVLSDVHLEMRRNQPPFQFKKSTPYLALCGDIGDPSSKLYEEFLFNQANRFDKVFVIAGNHEAYSRTVQESNNLIAEICAKRPDKLIHLDQTRYDLDEDLSILGCTLWSYINEQQAPTVKTFISDFRLIQDWSVDHNNAMHERHKQWLKKSLKDIENEERTAIVLTHHAPTNRNTSAPQHDTSPLSSAFYTDLDDMIKLPAVAFVSGHTHFSNQQVINGVQVVSNQVGYSGEDTRYKPGYYVDLG